MLDGEIKNLSKRMNFVIADSRPPVVFVLHHRAVLAAIWAAIKEGIFNPLPLLFRFDAHEDIGHEIVNDWEAIKSIDNIDDFLREIDKLRHDNGGWVKAAMELGLVGDVVTFYVPVDYPTSYKVDDTKYMNHTYKDHFGSEHRIFTFNRICEISDTPQHISKREKLIAFFEEIALDPQVLKFKHRPPLWFDIDLDFAMNDNRLPWDNKKFNEEFQDTRVSNFVKYLLRNAGLITIAIEPCYAGGFKGVAHILGNLRRIFGGTGISFEVNVL